MDTRKIHVRALSTISGIMQFEHEVQNIYFLGLEDFEGEVFISIESEEYSNEAVPLANNTFIIGQPMTIYNTTYTCQIYGVLNDGEKIQLSKRFRLIVDKSNDIQGDSEEYPVDPNFENSIIEFVNEQKSGIATYTDDKIDAIQATGDAVIASIPSDYSTLEQATYNAYPTQSESGNPIYIDDGARDIPIKDLTIKIEPKQSGEGDPSPTNVRPISGHDSINVIRTGKNVIPWTRTIGEVYNRNGITFTVNADYSVTVNGTATANADFIIARTENLPNGTIYISGGQSNNLQIRSNVSYVPADVGNGATWRKEPSDDGNMWIRVLNGATVDAVVYPMAQIDGTNIYSAPRNKVSHTIALPTTCYGGKLDITTGLLTVDRYYMHVDPTKIPDNYIHFDVLTNNARVGVM